MPKKVTKTRNGRSSRKVDDGDDNEPLYTPSVLSSDIDSDVDPVEHDVNYKIQSIQSAPLMELVDFFNDPKIINPSGDPTTNIIDRMKLKCYNVPERRIPKMFKLIENCRRSNIRLMMTERQTGSSGIMLDFDIYQNEEDDQLTDGLFNILTHKIMELLMSLLEFETKETVYVGITRKPKIMYNDEYDCYKDGFHMLIPGIKVTKGVRLLILNKLIENELIDQIMCEVEPADITIKGQSYTRSDFLDKMSATVPVFFIGSATKKGSSPYHLSHVFKVTINTDNKSIYVLPDSDFMRGSRTNVCHEFSLNYEAPKGVIKKRDYQVQEKFASAVQALEQKASPETEELAANFGALSMNSIHDGQIKEIKALLDVLNVRRADDYGEWRDVLCALANTSPSYKDLAEYFSRKSKKFNMVDFERAWNGIISNTGSKRKPLTIASIHYWAKLDNPERYKTVREANVFNVLYNMVYEGYREGILGHSDVSKLCYALLQHKFVTDVAEGERSKSWYEFILDSDDHVEGELYKWHKWKGMPSSLSLYISETLPKLFMNVFKRVKQNYERSTGDLSKYYAKVLQNFKATMRRLGDRNFKNNVIKEAEDKFSRRGFADSLDNKPLIRGVANGVLKLTLAPNAGPTLIQGYHTYPVSKFTPVPYIPFDPYDEITKKLLIALRNLFPDDEPDSFEFTMMYLASTIDSLPVESMFMITTGTGANGKSFLAELHKGAIGPTYGVKLPLSYLVCKSSHADNATPAVMMLQHASLATYSESNKHEVLNAARIKELTGLETIAGRKLHQDMINFKPRAHHWVCSNFDLDLGGSVDYGLERRIEYNPMKITFIDPKVNKYDEKNPYQRIADDTVTREWTEDPEVLGRYYGIMTWYHWHLYRKYRGKVKAVPHPHIRFETEKYIRRQDVIAAFLAQRFIKVEDETEQFDMVKEIQKYIKWHALNHGVIPAKGLIEAFQNSQIGKHIKLTKRGLFLTGHKFLDNDETPGENEEYAMKNIFDLNIPEDNFGIMPEDAEQFYSRTCREYDGLKHIFSNDSKYDVAVDALVDYNALGGNMTADDLKDLEAKVPGIQARSDNIEINGRILPCGVVLKSLESPSRNLLSDSFHMDMSGFLTNMDDMEVVSDAELHEDSDDFAE